MLISMCCVTLTIKYTSVLCLGLSTSVCPLAGLVVKSSEFRNEVFPEVTNSISYIKSTELV